MKRDLAKKMEILDARTDNAIARLVRERIEDAKKKSNAQDEAAGMQGEELVEGMHFREREAEADQQQESEDDDML